MTDFKNNILTVNTGSTSIRIALFDCEICELSIKISGIGEKEGVFKIQDQAGDLILEKKQAFKSHHDALSAFIKWWQNNANKEEIFAIGYRVVHGGDKFKAPTEITENVIFMLKKLISFDPVHLPTEISVIESMMQQFPNATHIACFDTAFHQSLPPVSKTLPIPIQFFEEGIYRYGFHGLSYESIMQSEKKLFKGKVLIAHLGGGSSMAAIDNGKCLDTSMAFTSTSGLVMGSRCGDIDPGLILYLIKEKGISLDELKTMISEKSGVKGISNITSDIKRLLELERDHENAKLAIDLFCYQAKKFIGGYAAILGGLDHLVFTGGIGENSTAVRSRICHNLSFLGIQLNVQENEKNASIISSDQSKVTVRVKKSNEELMIAKHTYTIIHKELVKEES